MRFSIEMIVIIGFDSYLLLLPSFDLLLLFLLFDSRLLPCLMFELWVLHAERDVLGGLEDLVSLVTKPCVFFNSYSNLCTFMTC